VLFNAFGTIQKTLIVLKEFELQDSIINYVLIRLHPVKVSCKGIKLMGL